jgi:hypothetical protein
MFIESVHKNAHPIVPQLYATVMKGSGKERLSRVEGEPFG